MKFAVALLMGSFVQQNNVVSADQPVHCLRGQVFGVWKFYVSSQVDHVNLFTVDEVCTHKVPNK